MDSRVLMWLGFGENMFRSGLASKHQSLHSHWWIPQAKGTMSSFLLLSSIGLKYPVCLAQWNRVFPIPTELQLGQAFTRRTDPVPSAEMHPSAFEVEYSQCFSQWSQGSGCLGRSRGLLWFTSQCKMRHVNPLDCLFYWAITSWGITETILKHFEHGN